MTDVDQLLRDDAERWNITETLALRLDDQLATALAHRPRHGRVLRPAFAAAGVAAILVVLAATGLLLRDDAPTSPPAATGRHTTITGVVWKDPLSGATVVYTRTTIRIFDGCTNTLAALSIQRRTLRQGHTLGPQGSCGGEPSGPGTQEQRRLQRFRDIVAGPASWTRHGETLTLRKPGTGVLHLTTNGKPAPAAVGSLWTLADYTNTDGYEHTYTGRPATLNITTTGQFRAGNTCTTLHGSAKVTADTIHFTTPRAGTCSQPANPAAVVLDHLLHATTRFTVRGTQLILDGAHGRVLIYNVRH